MIRFCTVWLLTLTLGTPNAGAAQQPIATHQPGPFAVGTRAWDFGQVQVTEPGSGGSSQLTVEHYGSVHYPAELAGDGTRMAAGGPFPFVVFGHGRYQAEPFVGENHLQAGYLLDRIASWGFVVASVNLDVVGQFANPAAIFQRSQLMHHTIDAFELDPFGWNVEFSRIGVVGHSRGGEGAIRTWLNNPHGHPVAAIATIAPTDFGGIQVEGVPYLSIYGSKDGDVNNGMPIRIYDSVRGSNKGFEYVEGANHFWFTESIHFSGEGAGEISRPEHHDVAATYITYFLVQTLGRPVEKSFRELADGASLFPLTDRLAIHPMYSSRDALVINDFEDEPADPAYNSLGGISRSGNLLLLEEQNLNSAALTLYHRTDGAALIYEPMDPAPYYLETLPQPVDARAYPFVSLRALQLLDAPQNTSGLDQDLRVVLLDENANIAALDLSAFGRVPWPVTHAGAAFPEKSVLRTTRIPMRRFFRANPALDLGNIVGVGFAYDLTPSADLRIDDIQFTD